MGSRFAQGLMDAVSAVKVPLVAGKVVAVRELTVEAVLPGASMGALAAVDDKLLRVAGIDGDTVQLVPLAGEDFGVGEAVQVQAMNPSILCGEGLVGRIVDPLCRPLDEGGEFGDVVPFALRRNPPNPLTRKRVDTPLVTGIRVLDGVLTVGQGQRVGLVAGAGQGKSTLLGDLARGASSDVTVVCLVGERGREAGEFVHGVLGTAGMERCVVVLATSDAPAAMRTMALETATAIAEWFRGNGNDVLLLVDSLTRVVRAKREMDIALGQAAGPTGYPASAFSLLPNLLERAGCDAEGTITGVYTVLTEKGQDDPVRAEVQSLLDGHIILSAKLADAGRWPAVDVVASVSRVMRQVVSPEQVEMAAKLRSVLAAYAENEDLVLMGAYREGTSPGTDAYLRHKEAIHAFLCQPSGKPSSQQETLAALQNLAALLP